MKAEPDVRRALALSLVALALATTAAAAEGAPPPSLELSTPVSEDGFFGVKWSVPEDIAEDHDALVFEVQERRGAGAFSTIYKGPDLATSISGQPAGTYEYRVRYGTGDGGGELTAPSPWSEVKTTKIRYHPLGRALLFLGLGASVFLATAAMIVGGHLRSRREGLS